MGVNTMVSIGNSDDRLSQAEWSRFVAEMRDLFRLSAGTVRIHGEWFANPDEPWQNANWCLEILPPSWWARASEQAGREHPSAMPQAILARDREMDTMRKELKNAVKGLCYRWRQDSFAWTTAPVELVETGWTEPAPAEQADTEQRQQELLRLATQAGATHWVSQAEREGWLPPGKTHLSHEDRMNLIHGGLSPELQDRMREFMGGLQDISKAAQHLIDQREMQAADRRRLPQPQAGQEHDHTAAASCPVPECVHSNPFGKAAS